VGQTHAKMAEACGGQAYAYNIIIIKKTYFKQIIKNIIIIYLSFLLLLLLSPFILFYLYIYYLWLTFYSSFGQTRTQNLSTVG